MRPSNFVASAFLCLPIALAASPQRGNAARSWGNYKKRAVDSADGTPKLSNNDPPAAQYSMGFNVNPETITASVQTTIKNDINSVISAFSNVPQYVRDLVQQGFSDVMNQVIYTQTPQQQFNTISNAINQKLADIESSIPGTFYDFLGKQTDDTGNIQALKTCVMQIVSMGGRKSDADGKCLTNSGLSTAGFVDQINAFIDVNSFQIPVNAQNAVAANITSYLASSALIPPVADLISATNEAIKNVVATVSAKDRDATQAAFKCWVTAIQQISEVPLSQRQIQCDQGIGSTGGVASKGTTLQDIQEAYQARVNQYAGVLPPNVVTAVQAIGSQALSLNLGPYDSAVRTTINNAILSNTAATSGETATVVSALINCLNTIYDDTPDNDCNPNTNPAVLKANTNIYYSYLAQFVSILPKQLVTDLNNTIVADMNAKDPMNAGQVNQQVQDLFKQASMGTQYESCARDFTDCVNAALIAGTDRTTCTGTLSNACGALPLQPSVDSGNPYGNINLSPTTTSSSASTAPTKRSRIFNSAEDAAKLMHNPSSFGAHTPGRANRVRAVHNSRSAIRKSPLSVAEHLVRSSSSLGDSGTWLSGHGVSQRGRDAWVAQLASSLIMPGPRS